MKNLANKFWNWYERNLKLNIGIAAGLFVWQIFHLIWLFGDVIFLKLFGVELFALEGFWEYFIILVDYTEVPAIISISLLYINDLRKGFNKKSIWFLILLNSQWLHLFWITDEFIVSQFQTVSSGTLLPVWLAWIAIGIDYLEFPVMYDTIKRYLKTLSRKKNF